jgi:hypothetical protein
MKKLSLLVTGLLVGGLAFGQTTSSKTVNTEEATTELQSYSDYIKTHPVAVKAGKAKASAAASLAGAGDTIVYFDFNGSLGNWANTVVSGPGGWAWSNQMSQGQYAQGTTTIQSPSGANGFLMLDADDHNTPGSASTFQSIDAYVTMPTQNLTNYPSVVLSFNHYFRHFSNAVLDVEVSNDGTNWTSFSVLGNVGVNNSSPNPLVERINITSIVGGRANAYIRFHWSGASHYFWQIDDVLLLEGEGNDMALEDYYTKPYSDTTYPHYKQVLHHDACKPSE